MKYFSTVIMTIAVVTLFSGCGKSQVPGHEGHDHAAHDHAGHASSAGTAHAADVEQTVQVGCAGCTYEQDWAEGCQTAVKIGDQVLLVKGIDFGAHEHGLCKGEKTAKITGYAEADHFAATKIELQP